MEIDKILFFRAHLHSFLSIEFPKADPVKTAKTFALLIFFFNKSALLIFLNLCYVFFDK